MPEASLLISGSSGMCIPLGMRFAEAAGTTLDQASAPQLLPHSAAWHRRKPEHNLFGQGFYMGQSGAVLGGNIHWSETRRLWQAALNVKAGGRMLKEELKIHQVPSLQHREASIPTTPYRGRSLTSQLLSICKKHCNEKQGEAGSYGYAVRN